MRIIICIFIVQIAFIGSIYASVDDVMNSIRTSLTSYIENEMQRNKRDYRYIENFGIGDWSNHRHKNTAFLVSNSLDVVFNNLVLCVTNQTERYVLFSMGWDFGDSYYASFFDRMLDKYETGNISEKEIKWFQAAHFSPNLSECFIRKYNEPLISNIINKIERLFLTTNECNKIRSGAALLEYLNFKKESEAIRR